jgi:hypothetical protein
LVSWSRRAQQDRVVTSLGPSRSLAGGSGRLRGAQSSNCAGICTGTDKEIVTSFQAVAANLAVEGEVCDLAHAKLSTPTETDLEIAPLIDNLTLMASATTKIVSDAISQWHPASNQQNASEVMAASTEDDIGAFRKSRHHRQSNTSELCQEADATEGTPTHAKV